LVGGEGAEAVVDRPSEQPREKEANDDEKDDQSDGGAQDEPSAGVRVWCGGIGGERGGGGVCHGLEWR
jgi:hypothetical protein